MNIITNINIPSSDKIMVKSFGRDVGFDFSYDYVEDFEKFVVSLNNTFRIDALFFFYPEYNVIPPGMDNLNIPLIAFVSDWNLGYYSLQASLSRFDLIVSDKLGLKALSKISNGVPVIHWNMYGFMPEQYRNIIKNKTETDLVFIGNVVPTIQKERSVFLKRIMGMNEQLRVQVSANIRGDGYVNALASSKLIFNRSIRSEANMRVFEALALGKMIFIEETNSEVPDYFEPGRECVLYNDDTLEETILEYVKNDEKREKIAKASFGKKDSFSFVRQLDKLYDLILSSGVMNSKRMRPFNGFIKTDKLYYSLVQSLGSSSILPSQVRFFQDFNELINTGNVYQRGLLIKLQYVLARTGGEFQNHAIDICKEIYCSSMQQDRSNIWNVFNYAALMETLGRNDEAIKALFEALDILGSSGSPNYSGVPCTFISEEWFQELNIYNYMDTKSCVASTTRLLGSLILTKLATIFASRNDNAEAVNLFRKAIEYYPQNSEANYWHGILTLPVNTQVAYRYLKSAYDLNSYNHRYWKPLLNTAQLLGRENECSGLRKEMERLKPLSESVYGQIENSTI